MRALVFGVVLLYKGLILRVSIPSLKLSLPFPAITPLSFLVGIKLSSSRPNKLRSVSLSCCLILSLVSYRFLFFLKEREHILVNLRYKGIGLFGELENVEAQGSRWRQ